MTTQQPSLSQRIQSTWRSMKQRCLAYCKQYATYPSLSEYAGGQYEEMDDSSSLSSEETKKKWEELLETIDLKEMFRDTFEQSQFIPITAASMKSRGGVQVPGPEDPVKKVLRMRELQRHQIEQHLYTYGNYLLKVPPGEILSEEWYRDHVVAALAQHPFDTASEPLVVYVPWMLRNSVFSFVHRIQKILNKLNDKHKANHTIDWWYRPVGQAQGHALVAIRLNGLYELTFEP